MAWVGPASKGYMDTTPTPVRTRIKRSHTIVLAWCTTRWNGIRHVATAHACVWKRNVHANEQYNLVRQLREGELDHQIPGDALMTDAFCYPASEEDPLGKTRATMLRRYEIFR